jgi:putative transcription factor
MAIQKARLAKNLSQKDLAKLLNIKVQIINDYEKGGDIIPNSVILSKLNNFLRYTSYL